MYVIKYVNTINWWWFVQPVDGLKMKQLMKWPEHQSICWSLGVATGTKPHKLQHASRVKCIIKNTPPPTRFNILSLNKRNESWPENILWGCKTSGSFFMWGDHEVINTCLYIDYWLSAQFMRLCPLNNIEIQYSIHMHTYTHSNTHIHTL